MASFNPSCNTVACVIDGLARFAAGMFLVVLGGLLTITFWLLPIGVPMGLLGLAILVSRSTQARAAADSVGEAILPSRRTPSQRAIQRIQAFVEKYRERTGTLPHPDPEVSRSVVLGLADNVDQIGRPLCPCNFYPDKRAAVAAGREWLCACDDMKRYKYCQCLLFVTPGGLPVTEHLPEGHEGRTIYGLVRDPAPDKGRESTITRMRKDSA